MSFESIGRTIGGLIGTAAGGFAGMDAGIIAGGGVGAVSGLGVGSIVTAPAGAIAGGAAGLAAGGAAGNALGKTAGAGAGRWIDNQILEARKADDKAKEKDKTGATSEDCAECEEERKKNPTKVDSPVWNDPKLKNEGNGRKSSGTGSKKKYYEWDHTHNDIEQYNSKGRHEGSLDPNTGARYKPKVRGRRIKL